MSGNYLPVRLSDPELQIKNAGIMLFYGDNKPEKSSIVVHLKFNEFQRLSGAMIH